MTGRPARVGRRVGRRVGQEGPCTVLSPSSALDTSAIDAGRDVGQTAAFVAELDGSAVVLLPSGTDGRFVDRETGSVFDLRGRALDGPLAGRQLEPVPHDDTFWFVWVAFRPDTVLVTP